MTKAIPVGRLLQGFRYYFHMQLGFGFSPAGYFAFQSTHKIFLARSLYVTELYILFKRYAGLM